MRGQRYQFPNPEFSITFFYFSNNHILLPEANRNTMDMAKIALSSASFARNHNSIVFLLDITAQYLSLGNKCLAGKGKWSKSSFIVMGLVITVTPL